MITAGAQISVLDIYICWAPLQFAPSTDESVHMRIDMTNLSRSANTQTKMFSRNNMGPTLFCPVLPAWHQTPLDPSQNDAEKKVSMPLLVRVYGTDTVKQFIDMWKCIKINKMHQTLNLLTPPNLSHTHTHTHIPKHTSKSSTALSNKRDYTHLTKTCNNRN